MAGVDNEIGVQCGDFRPADSRSLETEIFDQPAGFERFWIAEYAAATRLCVGLGGGPVTEIFAGLATQGLGIVSRLKPEAGREDQQWFLLQQAVAIVELQLFVFQFERFAPIQGHDFNGF